jgi:3,4-dihydroxy 2-butanone 4-phosphate synthase/GTP cyclohydrolase II
MGTDENHLRSPILYSRELAALRNRVLRAVEAFRNGEMILVGDDGRRENEADLVFHASAATTEHVNFAITHARGLLCVSVSHEVADRLAFHSAPKLPGGMAHTGFTLSVDARENITSGISAADRAYSIRLMADPSTQARDFISPGHVFPVRANDGGILARTGHTEALFELCQLAGLPAAAAMCEVLAPDGSALRPGALLAHASSEDHGQRLLLELPYLSTIDLLWYRIFYGTTFSGSTWRELKGFEIPEGEKCPTHTVTFDRGLEEYITLPVLIALHEKVLVPETIRIVLTNGLHNWDNGVSRQSACAEIVLFGEEHMTAPLNHSIYEFCDLSAKEGLSGTKPSVRRIVSELRALQYLKATYALDFPLQELVRKVSFPVKADRDFIESALML